MVAPAAYPSFSYHSLFWASNQAIIINEGIVHGGLRGFAGRDVGGTIGEDWSNLRDWTNLSIRSAAEDYGVGFEGGPGEPEMISVNDWGQLFACE